MSGNVPSNIPIPDPSLITAQEIAKAKVELRAEFAAAIDAARQVLETRFAAKDKADEVLSENVNRVPTLLDREISTLRGHTEERFAGLNRWISERFSGLERLGDERIEGLKTAFKEDKIAASTAVNAAFAAQKEASAQQNTSNSAAIAKSEASTTKELESLDGKISSLKESIARDISNLTGRLDRGEGGSEGRHAGSTSTLGLIAGAVGVMSLLVALALFVVRESTPNPAPTLIPGQVGTQTIPVPSHP